MDLKKHKNIIAISLFLACLFLAAFQTYKITSYIQEDYNNKLNQEINEISIVNLNTYNQIPNVELSLWSKSIWALVNIVYSLFIGGLIYGKIEWD